MNKLNSFLLITMTLSLLSCKKKMETRPGSMISPKKSDTIRPGLPGSLGKNTNGRETVKDTTLPTCKIESFYFLTESS